jgi:nucleotidyltransferase/DNA polymerase involved in DNA repair
MSLDEAYLDITAVVSSRNLPPEEIVQEIRARIVGYFQLNLILTR